MPAGPATLVPHAKFHFTRSYLWGIDIRVNTPVTNDGRFYHFHDGADPTRVFTVSVREKMWLWSSNHYTMDFIIEDSYFEDSVPPYFHLMDYRLDYDIILGDNKPRVTFFPFSIPFITPSLFAFPPAPPGYWLPPFT